MLEHFQTDTADYADYVLPATTQLEHWDIIKPYGHLHLALNRPAIAPVGQSLPNSEIFRRLAAALGYAEPCFAQSDEEILRQLVESQTHPTFDGITWDALLDKGFVRLNLPQPYLPFAQGGFPTPSGKCEFYSERMAQDGYDPLPAYTPPAWQQAGEPSIDTIAPLICISPPAHSFLNSSFVNVDRLRAREGQPLLRIHPADAAARDIADAATVRVWNERGEVHLVAALRRRPGPRHGPRPGVWWAKFSPDRRNVNQLTDQQQSDMAAAPSFYDVRVQVAPVAPPAAPEGASPAAVATAMRGDD